MSKKHRSTQKTVANNAQHDNFDPAEALESLHTEIVQIEALAHAAGEAVTRLPYPSDPSHRRIFTRIYALVTKVAYEIGTTVAHGDKLIADLGVHLEQQGQQDPEPSFATT